MNRPDLEIPMHEHLRSLIYQRIGLRRPSRGWERVDDLIKTRMQALGISSTEQYESFLESSGKRNQAELRELSICLTNGETHFFRDAGQFSLLQCTLLPSLIQENASSKTLRVWSAGCATGEEAYSIAIVIAEILRNHADWSIEILGTDINRRSLCQARAGVYPKWSFRTISDERRDALFEHRIDHWKLKARLRRKVRFKHVDLVRDSYPSVESGTQDMDLIFCRNVFIYFEPKTIEQVLAKMSRALRPGGYLLTAHGELHGQDLSQWRVLDFPNSAVYQKEVLVEPLTEPEVHATAMPTSSPSGIAEFERLAQRCANEGNYQEAEEWCRRALGEDPLSVSIYYLLSRIAEERKEIERAKEMLKKVLYLDPLFVSAYIDLAALYHNENDSKRAMKLRHSALDCLRAMQPDAWIAGYGVTAAELLSAVRKMIHGSVAHD